jgi:hypothetical protein
MITERDEEQRDERRAFALALIASAGINLAVWMFAVWGYSLQFKSVAIEPKEREFIVSSTSIRIDRRTIPRPQHPIQRTQPVARPSLMQRAQLPEKTAPVKPQPRPTEIARIVRNAPPQPPPGKPTRQTAVLAEQLAQQEQAFAREAQKLNSSRAPLSIATNSPLAASASRQAQMDISGRNERESVEAVLEPLKHWYANGMSCYYAHYYAQYAGGGSEDGTIPWPICYPVAHDAMLPLDRSHRLPIPEPPIGYVLPAGTTLAPLLEAIYTKHASEEPHD